MIGTIASVLCYSSDWSKSYMRNKDQRIPGVKFARPTILLVQYGAGLITILSWIWKREYLLVPYQSAEMVLTGVVVGFIGFVLLITAKRTLAANYSPCFHAYVPSDITTSGIYGAIRHPIYTANLLIVFSTYLMSGSLLILIMLAMLMSVYIRSAKIEEDALSIKFPAYRSYVASSGRFFPKILLDRPD